MLMDRVWGHDVECEPNVLEVYVKQLRQKLEAINEAGLSPVPWTQGYAPRGMNDARSKLIGLT